MEVTSAPPGTSRPYHHGDLGNTLVELALARIAGSGSVEFTVRGLAREAGVSHVAAYRHFADKRALLARIAELGFGRLVDALRVEESTVDAAEAFRRQGLAYARFALDHPEHFRVMWHHELADRAAFPPLMAASQAAYGCIRDTVATLHDAGLTRAGLGVDDLTVFAWAGIHGISTLLLDGVVARGGGSEPDRILTLVADLLRDAVLA